MNGKMKGFWMLALALALVMGMAIPQAGLAQTGTSPSDPFALAASGARPESGTNSRTAVALPALAIQSTGQTISLAAEVSASGQSKASNASRLCACAVQAK
jgi:hypothetical protein